MSATAPSAERASGTESERVAGELRNGILAGRIRPGDWLRQDDLAERLGASRLPVREALRILEAEGLIEYEPNRGARVPLLSAHEVGVIYQIRERLEPLALVESLAELNQSDIAELESLQHRIEHCDDVDEFLELDRTFHLLTYSGCRSSHINSVVTRLWNSTQYYRRVFMTGNHGDRMPIVNAEHRLLLDAIIRRDPVDAERFLAGHIRRTRVELAQS